MADDTTTTVDHVEQWVCIGKRLNRRTGRLVQHWRHLDGCAGDTAPTFSVGNVFVAGAAVGSVYEVSVAPHGGYYAKGWHAPKWITRTNGPHVDGWTAADLADKAEHERIRQAKRANDESSEVEEALALLRRAYHECGKTTANRAGFLAYLTAEITNYAKYTKDPLRTL